jgi:photosystem II stability/assembly factor-like uncharacterized protein
MNRRVSLTALLLLLLPLAALAGVDRWTRVGPEAGAVLTLAAAPSHMSTVYAGLASGGVFRSGDGGVTWSFAGTGLDLRDDPVRSLVVDARRPGLLWAATSQGIYRSANGGAGWSLAYASGVTAIIQDPAAGTLYAGDETGGPLLRSRDGGASWQPLAGSPAGTLTLALDPSRPRILYAGTSFGAYKSTNGGATWMQITNGLPTFPIVLAIAVSPRSPRTLYLATNSRTPGEVVFRSDDGGARWTPVDGGMLPGTTYALAVQPGKRETVWAVSGGRFFRSLDRGRTWSEAGAGIPAGDDSRAAILPGASTVLAGNGSGVFRSADQGTSWSLSNRGIHAARITSLALDPLRPMRLWALTTRVYRTVDGGGRWVPLAGAPHPAGVGGPLAADPRHPGTAYLGLLGGAARTTDGGNHWDSGGPLPCMKPKMFAFDPLDASAVYVTGSFYDNIPGCGQLPNPCGSFRSDDGRLWGCIDFGNFLAPDPFQPSRVYALEGGDLHVSADRGASWSLLAANVQLTLLVPDSRRPGTLWGGGASRVSRSDDGGRTWTPARTGIPPRAQVNALVLDPVDPEVLYASTLQHGVFKTVDGGATWARLGTGLEGLTVRFLALDPRSRGTLYTGTDEAGVLKIQQSGS